MNIGFWKALKIAAGVSIGWTVVPGVIIGVSRFVAEKLDLDINV